MSVLFPRKKLRGDEDVGNDEVSPTDLVLPASIKLSRSSECYWTTNNYAIQTSPSTALLFEYNDMGGGIGPSIFGRVNALLWECSGSDLGTVTILKQSLVRVPLGANSYSRQSRMIIVRRIEVKMFLQELIRNNVAAGQTPWGVYKFSLVLDRQFNGNITMPTTINQDLFEENPVYTTGNGQVTEGSILSFPNRGNVGRFVVLKEQVVDFELFSSMPQKLYVVNSTTPPYETTPVLAPQAKFVYWDIDNVVIPILYNDAASFPVDTVTGTQPYTGSVTAPFYGGNCPLQSVTSNNLMLICQNCCSPGNTFLSAVNCTTRITFENAV